MKRLLVLLAFTAACGGAHKEYLHREYGFDGEHVEGVRVAEVPVNGFQVRLVTRDGTKYEGEVLASETDYVFVRNPEKGVIGVGWQDLKEIRIDIAPGRPGEPAGSIIWTVVGGASTITHGWFLIFTLPAWLGAGIPISILHGRSNRTTAPAAEVKATLSAFARFPQGLPPGFAGIRPGSAPTPLPSAAPVPGPVDAGAPASGTLHL